MREEKHSCHIHTEDPSVSGSSRSKTKPGGRPQLPPVVDEACSPPTLAPTVPGARPPSVPVSLVSRHPLSLAFPAFTVLGARRPDVDVLGVMAPAPVFPAPTACLRLYPSLSPVSLPLWNKKRHTCTGHHLWLVTLISLLGESMHSSVSVSKNHMQINTL